MSIQFWHDKFASRFNWAFQEYDRFISGLEPSVAGEFGRKDQITVVLYGHTQAGKTTVLLTLLGLEERFFKQVSDILRGGRAEGNSATATAAFYAKSPSGKWSLNDLHDLSDDEMLAQLIAIRSKVNRGAYQSTAPVRIEIPSCYFHPTRFDNVGFQIVDLPGTCCENENEKALVSRIAETYVPYADMVLIVNDASKLTYLQSENMVLEQLKTWYVLPEKFHLVLTRSFTADSIRRQFSVNNIPSADEIQNLMLHELQHTLGEKECPVNNSKFRSFFYPLDCGKSWQALKAKDPDFYRAVKPVMDSFLESLTDDIIRSATPLGRVRMAGRVKPVAEHHKEQRTEEYEAEVQKLLDEQFAIQQKYDEFDEMKKNQEEMRNHLYDMLQMYRQEMMQKFPDDITISPFSAPYNLDKRRTNVINYLDSEIGRLKAIWNFFRICASNIGVSLEEKSLYTALAWLNNVSRSDLGGWGGGSETYCSWFGKDGYGEDCCTAEKASSNSCVALTSLIRSKDTEINAAFKKKIGDIEAKLASYHPALKKYMEQMEEKESMLKQMEGKHRFFIEAIDRTINQASSFHQCLCNAFDKHVSRETALLLKQKELDTQFFQLCYLKLLKDTRKEILTNEN